MKQAPEAKAAATDFPVTLNDVRVAARAIAGSVVQTPFTQSVTLSKMAGCSLFIKFENLQFTAAFKERGALNKLLNLTDAQKKAGVIANSAGNHAQGVAYHAQRLGIPAVIVMPCNTPFVKVSQTQQFGAKVELFGEKFDDTVEFTRNLAQTKGYTYIHPFDDAEVIAGQGTIGLEMLEAVPDLDILAIPVGGGGLISGIAVAAKALNPNIKVIGVQTARFPSLYRALRDEPYAPKGNSLAEGIAVKTIGELPLKICRQLVDDVLLVSEDALERAVSLYLNIEKTVTEGAGAAGLAAVLSYPEIFKDKKVGTVITGGNIDPRLLASLLMRGLVREGRITRLRIELSDVPGALAAVTQIIGSRGANIVDIAHHRLFTQLPAKETYSDITLETRDRLHLDDILVALREAGFTTHLNNSDTGSS